MLISWRVASGEWRNKVFCWVCSSVLWAFHQLLSLLLFVPWVPFLDLQHDPWPGSLLWRSTESRVKEVVAKGGRKASCHAEQVMDQAGGEGTLT